MVRHRGQIESNILFHESILGFYQGLMENNSPLGLGFYISYMPTVMDLALTYIFYTADSIYYILQIS